jgi:hypothetical protein
VLPLPKGEVVCRERLGGLLRHYCAQRPDQQAQPIRLRWLPGDRSPHAPGGDSPILPAQPSVCDRFSTSNSLTICDSGLGSNLRLILILRGHDYLHS